MPVTEAVTIEARHLEFRQLQIHDSCFSSGLPSEAKTVPTIDAPSFDRPSPNQTAAFPGSPHRQHLPVMASFKLTSKQKLIATIGISFCFFVAEIAVAFYTRSLALLADAFHYVFLPGLTSRAALTYMCIDE